MKLTAAQRQDVIETAYRDYFAAVASDPTSDGATTFSEDSEALFKLVFMRAVHPHELFHTDDEESRMEYNRVFKLALGRILPQIEGRAIRARLQAIRDEMAARL